jgi:hypothetical protein
LYDVKRVRGLGVEGIDLVVYCRGIIASRWWWWWWRRKRRRRRRRMEGGADG